MSNSHRPGSPLDLYKLCAASAPEYLTPMAPLVLGRLWEGMEENLEKGM